MSLYRLNEGSNPKKPSLKSIILGPSSKEEWNYAFKHNPKKKMSWKNLNLIDKGFRHDPNKPYSWKNINKKHVLAKAAFAGAVGYAEYKLLKRLRK